MILIRATQSCGLIVQPRNVNSVDCMLRPARGTQARCTDATKCTICEIRKFYITQIILYDDGAFNLEMMKQHKTGLTGT